MRRRPLSAALALLVLALLPSAGSGAGWLAPVALTDAVSGAPAVATGPGGDAVAVWSVNSTIQARVRAPGGAFGELQTLSATGSAPAVAMAADGTAIAAWFENDKVRVAVRAPGGIFAPAQDLPADGVNGTPSLLDVVANDAGDALIVYLRGGPMAALRPAGGAFGTPAALAASGCNPRGAIGAGGHAAVVWQTSCAASEIRVARRNPGEPFGASGLVGGDTGTNPAVAVEADGTTVAAHERAGGIRVNSAGPSAAFSGGTTIGDAPAAEPAVAAGGGEVWLVWRSSGGGVDKVAAARRPAGGAFATVPNVSPDGIAAGPPRLHGATGTGAMLAAWLRKIGDDTRVEAAWREPGAAAFGPAAPASAAAANAVLGDLGGDGDGNSAAGYLLAGKPVAQVFDGAGPRLLGVEVRPAGFALEPYPFAVAPSDAWSAIASSAFDFGDSVTAAGPSATHAYAEPAGPRTVTVSATDALGNTAHVQKPFQVAPALDRTAPVISAVRLDARRFRIYNKPTPASISATRRGTRFRYTLSEPAVVTIAFERLVNGRRKGKQCVRGRRTGSLCKISEPSGGLVRVHPVAGPVSVGFTGRVTANIGPLRIYDNTLLPGRYRVTFSANDASRNISQPLKTSFTIVTR